MAKMTFVITGFLSLIITYVNGQAIDYSTSYRSATTEKSFRISYENDFFSASDRDYTQGVYIEFVNPGLGRSFLSRLTWHPEAGSRLYGLAVETDGYTPNNIDKPGIQYNDRPYASTLLLRSFNTSVNSQNRTRITNSLTLGVLGPWAGGKEIQTGIHQWIGYTKPLGWHNQIHNEPVINYQVNVEKQLAGDHRHFILSAMATARAGTLSTKAGAGLTLMTGSFADPFVSDAPDKKKLHVHVYDHAMINAVAYDATLQGGLINQTSPYTLPSGVINRLVFQNRFGLVFSFRNILLEYWQSFITREYKSGIEPKTGGVQFAVRL